LRAASAGFDTPNAAVKHNFGNTQGLGASATLCRPVWPVQLSSTAIWTRNSLSMDEAETRVTSLVADDLGINFLGPYTFKRGRSGVPDTDWRMRM
jgi:hypothetical protein